MSLENLKEILDKSEALMHYKSVKERNIVLENRVKNVQYENRRLRKENAELKDLKVYVGKEFSLEEFKDKVREETRRAKREEINLNVQKKFEKMKLSLTRKELNRLLKLPKEERPPTLNEVMDVERDREMEHILRTEDLWPLWFKRFVEKKIKDEIEKRLNNIYWANVREGVRKAKEEDWDPYFEKYMREKITPYCRTILLQRFLTNQEFSLTCKKCNTFYYPIQLTEDQVSQMLEKGFTFFACTTQNCIEGIWKKHPTHICFYLGEAIPQIVSKPRMP